MEDTTSEVKAIQQKMWMTLTVEERLRRLGELFAFGKACIEARAPAGISEEEKRRFVFREMYGFDPPTRK